MGLLRPVGPLPASAYWLRRGLVLVLLVAVVLGGWWLLVGRSSGAPAAADPGTHPSGSPSPSTTASVSTSPSPSRSASTSPSPSHSASPATSAGAACPDSTIRVVAATDASSYAASAKPHLTITVTNIGDTSCKRDLGQAALELVVSSGTTRVWSSDDCNPGGGHAVVLLKSGQSFSSSVIWERTTSKPGCPAGQPKAAPGPFHVTGRNLTLRSAPASFVLR
jgi:hypothetical protein